MKPSLTTANATTTDEHLSGQKATSRVSKLLSLFLGSAALLVGGLILSESSQACPTQASSCAPEPVETEVVDTSTTCAEAVSPCETETAAIEHVQPAGLFLCEDVYGTPTTSFYAPEGGLPVIHWVSEYFTHSGYDPQTRCADVSLRFQRYYDAGVLNYITTGIINRQPVVCVADFVGGPCTGLLFTLKPEENASRVVQQLFDISYANAGPLYESDSRIYLNVNEHLSALMDGQ